MSTATKTKTTADGYRVTLRHTPFRTKSRVVDAASADEAWTAFLALLREENKTLQPAQQLSFGKQQAEWLAVRDQFPGVRPPHCEIVTEAEHQKRIHAAADRENESRLALERSQQAQQGTNEQMVALMAEVVRLQQQLAQQHQNRGK